MKKRHLTIAAATLGLAVLSTSALANFAVYDDTNHLYTGASLNYYHFGTPDLGVGTKSATSNSALTNIKTGGSALMPSLTVGYHFNNDFLSGFFGNKANIEINGSFASFSSTDSNGDLGSGYYRLIDGTEGYLAGSNQTMTNFHANTDSKYQNVSLMYRGDHESQTQTFTQQPEMGLVYTHLTQDTDYNMQWAINPAPNTSTFHNKVSEDVATNYIGLAFGDTVKLQMSRHLFANAGAQLQLLHASASLTGSQSESGSNQQTGAFTTNTAKASDSLSSFTYRGILSAGMNYAFSLKPDSPSLGFTVGYDRLGFTPTVQNPTGSSAKKAHLESAGSNNFFTGLNFHLPL